MKNIANSIPKRLKLLGRTITVEYDPAVFHDSDAHGFAKYRQDKIVLQPSSPQTPITEEAVQHTFFHELVHHALYWAGDDEFDPPLHRREYFVDRLAGLIHQAITTAEYEDKPEEV